MTPEKTAKKELDPRKSFLNRELSWLQFASRVLAQVDDESLPLLERVKFAGIVGMLHDEFFMKRMSGLKRQMKKSSQKLSIDGRKPAEEYEVCRKELHKQFEQLNAAMKKRLLPAMAEAGIPILSYNQLDAEQKKSLRTYFKKSVQPILTPLAVDSEHPFPFISNFGLNLAVMLPEKKGARFVRLKVPGNRPRWIPLPDGSGFVPLEQIIAANLKQLFPDTPPSDVYVFRVTRGAEGEQSADNADLQDDDTRPGSIIRLVTSELKARRFAGVVRLQVDTRMPKKLRGWLAEQLGVNEAEIYRVGGIIGVNNLMRFDVEGRRKLRFPEHRPANHPRLAPLPPADPAAIFDEIARGDILLHHPYQSFDASVLRFIESAAVDPAVLAIKLTIYRTSEDSPIVRALAEAARLGKQVAVLVEITARFDEAPNIAWGKYLEKEGVHVAYGVERLKTHVKLALVVREEDDGIRSYLHVGTGNYHTGTAKIYEDIGILTCEPEICEDAAMVFNALTGSTSPGRYNRILVAPRLMRERFVELIRREADHAKAGRPSGIHAKLNQLQDPEMIKELYAASSKGVSIDLNVRGLCCLRPGVKGLSENIRVFGVVGRFLEHSRIYSFTNGGEPEIYIGSADWMRRNLDKRVETITPIEDEKAKQQVARILQVYVDDNSSVWDCGPDGSYTRRKPRPGDPVRRCQEQLIRLAQGLDLEPKMESTA